jgi:AcrR family transcriptional regulator
VDVNLPARLTRAEAQARTRRRLLESGARVFARKGFAAATIEEIAERAGFTRGAFYANFDDKGDLFLSILEEQTAAAMRSVGEAVAGAPDDAKLGAILEWFDRLVVDRRLEMAFGEVLAVAARDRSMRARLERRYRMILGAVTAMIDDYCASAGLSLPVATADVATMVVSLVEGLTTARRVVPDAVPPERLAETLTYLWTGLLSAPPAARR